MLVNLPEIILIMLIIFLIFGMGQLPNVASRLGRLRSELQRDSGKQETIDITPERSQPDPSRKPGKFEPGVDEAKIEDA